MNIHKRILSVIAITLITIGAISSPLLKTRNALYCYADDTIDDWQNVTTNEQLVEAFQYYCKSRDITFEGSVADAVTSFTTQTFQNACRGAGIDMNSIQAHLKYDTDNLGNTRYLFDATGISLYNRIFAQFLQDNELEVGDENVNKNINDGYSYNGISCYEYASSTNNGVNSQTLSAVCTKKGSAINGL